MGLVGRLYGPCDTGVIEGHARWDACGGLTPNGRGSPGKNYVCPMKGSGKNVNNSGLSMVDFTRVLASLVVICLLHEG